MEKTERERRGRASEEARTAEGTTRNTRRGEKEKRGGGGNGRLGWEDGGKEEKKRKRKRKRKREGDAGCGMKMCEMGTGEGEKGTERDSDTETEPDALGEGVREERKSTFAFGSLSLSLSLPINLALLSSVRAVPALALACIRSPLLRGRSLPSVSLQPAPQHSTDPAGLGLAWPPLLLCPLPLLAPMATRPSSAP